MLRYLALHDRAAIGVELAAVSLYHFGIVEAQLEPGSLRCTEESGLVFYGAEEIDSPSHVELAVGRGLVRSFCFGTKGATLVCTTSTSIRLFHGMLLGHDISAVAVDLAMYSCVFDEVKG